MNTSVKKIALIGPESTGKTTLCKQLAEHFQTVWVREFARGYISSLNRKYTLEDIEHCAREQLKQEEEQLAKASHFLFCDTELIIAKVWCEDVFKTVPQWIEEMIGRHRYDLFLLTSPDIPFEKDNVRENPHRGEFFFKRYRSELIKRNFSFEIVNGKGSRRLSNALQYLQKIFLDAT